jgi:hypothetical protein
MVKGEYLLDLESIGVLQSYYIPGVSQSILAQLSATPQDN